MEEPGDTWVPMLVDGPNGFFREFRGSADDPLLTVDSGRSFGWHDVGIRVEGAPHFAQRFANHVETGAESYSDPRMADVKRV